MKVLSLFSGIGAFEKANKNQIKFNDEETFNKIVKDCKECSDSEIKEWTSFNI